MRVPSPVHAIKSRLRFAVLTKLTTQFRRPQRRLPAPSWYVNHGGRFRSRHRRDGEPPTPGLASLGDWRLWPPTIGVIGTLRRLACGRQLDEKEDGAEATTIRGPGVAAAGIGIRNERQQSTVAIEEVRSIRRCKPPYVRIGGDYRQELAIGRPAGILIEVTFASQIRSPVRSNARTMFSVTTTKRSPSGDQSRPTAASSGIVNSGWDRSARLPAEG